MWNKGVYIVALSGGADSVYLLHYMLRQGVKVEAAHCNFHLRGNESDRDESFCRKLCDRLGVRLHIAHFDTKTYATLHHVSIEMAARDLRYNYFHQLAADMKAEGICVAHHADDNVETMLMNLMRGTGVKGLGGMRERNGLIIRPLLGLWRKDIEACLQEMGEDYITDSSNLVPDVVRNKIRLQLIPLMQEIMPAAKERINSAAAHIAEAATIVEECMNQQEAECRQPSAVHPIFNVGKISAQVAPATLLHHIMYKYGFNSAQQAELLKSICQQTSADSFAKRGTKLWQSEQYEAVLWGGTLSIVPREEKVHTHLTILEPGTYIIGNKQRISIKLIPRSELTNIPREPHTVALDASVVTFPLTLRSPQIADRFAPFGMKGKRKLLSDFLTDAGIAPLKRRTITVLASADGAIHWIVGLRPSHHAAITNKTTSVLLASVDDYLQEDAFCG